MVTAHCKHIWYVFFTLVTYVVHICCMCTNTMQRSIAQLFHKFQYESDIIWIKSQLPIENEQVNYILSAIKKEKVHGDNNHTLLSCIYVHLSNFHLLEDFHINLERFWDDLELGILFILTFLASSRSSRILIRFVTLLKTRSHLMIIQLRHRTSAIVL